jgi:GNAT superfamily N-acetyltransferase
MARGALRLQVREVTADCWVDFERLFEAKGSPKYCWCMAWRAKSRKAELASKDDRKGAMAARVKAGIPVGLLGYLEGEPVAWCSVAPRSTYRRLVKDSASEEAIWSVVCFFVVRQFRGMGLSKQMLIAAMKHARRQGARILEAYPVDETSPSYRFMGLMPMYAEAGFREIGHEGSRRHIMQCELHPTKGGD